MLPAGHFQSDSTFDFPPFFWQPGSAPTSGTPRFVAGPATAIKNVIFKGNLSKIGDRQDRGGQLGMDRRGKGGC